MGSYILTYWRKGIGISKSLQPKNANNREDIPLPEVDPLANPSEKGEVRQLQITDSFPDSLFHNH